jgi:hypothetical protein
MSSKHLWFKFLIKLFLVFISFSLSLIFTHSCLSALFSSFFHSFSLTHLLVSFAMIRHIFNFLYVVAEINKLQTMSSMLLINFGGWGFLWIQVWSLDAIFDFANKSQWWSIAVQSWVKEGEVGLGLWVENKSRQGFWWRQRVRQNW